MGAMEFCNGFFIVIGDGVGASEIFPFDWAVVPGVFFVAGLEGVGGLSYGAVFYESAADAG